MAVTVLRPFGRSRTTPSSPCPAGAKSLVTSVPFTATRTASTGTDPGTSTRTRAAPPLTYFAGPDTTSSRNPSCHPRGDALAPTVLTRQANTATTTTNRRTIASSQFSRSPR